MKEGVCFIRRIKRLHGTLASHDVLRKGLFRTLSLQALQALQAPGLVRGGRGRGAAGMGLEAIRASTAVAVTVTRHVVLPRAARVFSGASRQPRIPAVMASFSQHALRQLVTSPSSTADQQKRSAVQQRALSSGQRGVWGLLDAVQG